MKTSGGHHHLVCAVIAVATLLVPLGHADAQFNHQITLKLPKGTNGIQPDLALVYVPGGGNGMVGMGWQLTGLSTITRANDGNGINYDGGDTYAHSQLGVLGGQPDGSYRSKKETFTKLVPSGTCGDGPCSWVAYDRSGLRFYFGTTADSRLLTHATGSVGTWGLAKVADLFGNSFEVEYTNDAANGVLYPSVITYTKGPGVTAYRTVEFAYEPRADVEPGYYQSAFQQTTARLKWIEVRSAGELLRKYRLDYGEYGAATGRSHLTAVQEYGSDGTSTLPAQNFVWQQGGQGFGFERWGTQQGGWVDGDDWPKESTFLTGDFDGDGRTDVACVFYDAGSISIDVHLATGGSFAWQRWSTKQGGWVGGDDWAKRSMFLTGDFDGDGKTDIAYVFNDGGLISMDVHRSTGSSFISERWATRQGGWINGDDWQKKSQFLQGDFNGDGKTDIAYIFNDGGLISMDVHRSTGSSFVWGRWATQQGGWVNEDDWEKKSIFLPGDFNGDGKTDVAYVFNDGGLISMDVHGSTGSSFSWERWATQQGGWVGGDDWQRNSIFLPGDFNGDGRTDLAYVFNDSGHISMDVHSSTGGSFSWERWATQQGGWIGGDDWQKKSTFLSGDFDGDGKADIAYVFNDGGGQSYDVHSSASPAPDLMTRVENGLGGTVTISYAPAPQVPNAIVPASAAPGIPNTSPQQLITRVTTTDGRGGTYSTQSNYYDARLYPGTIQDQRVLGFGYIETVDIQTGQLMRQYYDQHPGYEDHLAQEDAYTAAGQLISRKSHQYELVYPNPGTELAREIVLIAETYELGAPAFTQRTVRSYDAYGNATVVSQDADRLPNVTVNTTFSNDSANWILGRIAEVKTSSGGTTLGWMKNEWAGNVIAQKAEWLDTTNAWVATTMTYDTSGNIASVTEPPTGDGLVRTTTTEYDSTFKTYPTKVTNALGHAVQRSYNADGLIAAVIDVNGHSTAATYDVFGRKVGETRADGGTTSYSYMNYGDPWSQANWTRTTVGSQVLESAELFDGAGFKYRVSTSGDEGRTVCVDSAKDAAGRTAQVSLPHFCGEPARWTTTTYDIAGRPSTVSAPDGNVTTYAYATDHTSVKDPSGGVTAKYYDSRQKTTAVVDAAGQTTSFGNDALGRLNWVKLPDGSVTTTAYDSLNHKTSVADPHLGTTAYSYDAVGNMTSLTSAGKTIKYKYDALNRVARKQPVGEDAARYTYDEAATANGRGRLTSSVDAGGTTRFTYTSTGQLNSYAKRIDGSEYSQHFTYDTSGRLTQLTYPDGSYADYLYAGGRNLSSVSLNGTAYATWSNYNASGKPETVTYGNGVGTAYGYDVMNRLTSLATSKSTNTLQNVTYTFGTGGLDIGSITDNRPEKIALDGTNSDETQSYTYDALHRLIGAVGVWGTKHYVYDSIGNMTAFGGLKDRTLAYSGQQVTSGTGLKDVKYDVAGNMTQKVLDGVLSRYTWTAENRLASVTRRVVGEHWDPRDEPGCDDVKGDARGDADTSQGPQADRDDDAGTDDGCSKAPVCREGGAGDGERPKESDTDTTSLMTYDANGQRVKKVFFFKPGKAVTTTYIGNAYEKRVLSNGSQRHTINLYANGQLIATWTRAGCVATALGPLPPHRREMQLASTFNGRSAVGAVMKTLHFLAAVVMHPKIPLVLYATFALGLAGVFVVAAVRLRRGTAGTRWARPHLGLGLRLASLSTVLVFTMTACSGGGGGGGKGHSRDANRLLSGDTLSGPAIGTYFYHSNHLGSATVTTDASGNEGTRYVYLPYGEISKANSLGLDAATKKFTGQEYDEETGLYYYGARYYDPAVGRFISADTVVPNLANAQAWNRYAYVANNPIIYVDPTGHSFWSSLVDAFTWVFPVWAFANGLAGKVINNYVRSAKNAWDALRQMATHPDPATIATLLLATALSVAAQNPAPLQLWAQATAAAITATSMAMAAGVRNPIALGLIAAMAGAAGAGASTLREFLKTGAAWGANQGLQKLEGDKLSYWLAPLNGLGSSVVVNASAGKANWVFTKDGALDPPIDGDLRNAAAASASPLPEQGGIPSVNGGLLGDKLSLTLSTPPVEGVSLSVGGSYDLQSTDWGVTGKLNLGLGPWKIWEGLELGTNFAGMRGGVGSWTCGSVGITPAGYNSFQVMFEGLAYPGRWGGM